MNFLTDNVKKLYSRFLAASMCSALVMSIYSFVDTIAVGQSEGMLGAAAMAVITPLYGILIFLAILVGVGGSVLMSNAKGEGKEEKGNAYFTASIILMCVLTAVCWFAFILFNKEIFTFFGADANLMPKVMEYAEWIIWFFPFFIVPTFISSFIRNDGAPTLAMAAVIIGGCTNIFLDWFLVFPLDMGMRGAAIATVVGTVLQVLINGDYKEVFKQPLCLLVEDINLSQLYAESSKEREKVRKNRNLTKLKQKLIIELEEIMKIKKS